MNKIYPNVGISRIFINEKIYPNVGISRIFINEKIYYNVEVSRIFLMKRFTPMWELAPENGLLQKQRLRRP